MIKKIRQIHFYLGVLFAPSIIFFALTGAIQTFRWQENGAAGAATPFLTQMAAIHKDQTLTTHERPQNGPPTDAGRPATPPRQAEPPEAGRSSGPSPLPMKIYVFLMSLGLMTSTLTGIYMAFQYKRDRRTIWGLLIAGVVIPVVLLLI